MMTIRTALITGGAQGIGKATAIHFYNSGLFVVAADKDEEAGNELTERLDSQLFMFVKTDFESESDINNLISKITEKTGRIDYLVNNCGISIFKPMPELKLEEWNHIINTNLTSAFLTTKSAFPLLKINKGRIVNIASTRALMSEPGNEAYTASKGGIIALTHALANSLGPDVLVNCISPGWIDVTSWKKSSLAKQADLSVRDHQQHPAGRVGTPEDIAQLAYFLCAEQNGFITGQNFVVDGGMVRKMIYE